MKYKNRQLTLKARQAMYDRMNAQTQHSNTRPGSQKK